MLVVLGGLVGSGAKTLAAQLAVKYGMHHYDINQKKLRKPVLNRYGNFAILQPTTDKERVKVYESVLNEFRLLSKMYPDVVVDDVFHREMSREYFLSEARKYYKPVVFVWIESDDISVRKRLARMQETGQVRSVAGALRSREMGNKKLQLPPPSTARFSYRVSGDEKIAAQQVTALWELIQQQA